MYDDSVLSNQFLLLDFLPNGAFILDKDFTVIYWNRCLENWTKIKKEDILRQNISHFFPHLLAQKYRKRIEPIFQGSPPVIFSSYLHQHLIPSLLPNNQFRIQHTIVNSFFDDFNNQYYALFIIQDVTELTQRMLDYRQLKEHLYKLSIKDPLTGLYNRRYLEDEVEKEIERCQRYKLNLGVIMIDIDHFKEINDTFGHDSGDFVLKIIGNLLISNIRKSDLACRYGGEEFTVILIEQNLVETKNKAENLRKLIESQKIVYQEQCFLKITASFGVANYPQDGLTLSSLLRAGDVALYYSKHHGRNQVN